MLPSKSPGLNIIEKVWAVTKEKVYGSCPPTVSSLRKAIKKAWNEVDEDFNQALLARISKIIKKVTQLHGNIVDK